MDAEQIADAIWAMIIELPVTTQDVIEEVIELLNKNIES